MKCKIWTRERFVNIYEVVRSCLCFLVFTTCTLNVSINLILPLQNRWLKEICTKSSRFMFPHHWTQKHWMICRCSLSWMVMSVHINTTNVCAVWALAWTRIKNMVYWSYLKAVNMEQVRKQAVTSHRELLLLCIHVMGHGTPLSLFLWA